MDTNSPTPESRLVADLEKGSWNDLLRSVDEAVAWISTRPLGAIETEAVIESLARLSGHSKWEVRRAIAIAAGSVRHRALGEALPRLLADPNARVAEAAETSSIKRRDWRASGQLGREHASRVNRTLGDIDERYGVRGRIAVQRAAAEMVSTFSRELYHEVVRHITPLQREIAKLRDSIACGSPAGVLTTHADTMRQDVDQIMSVLKNMRKYASAPVVDFEEEFLREVVDEAIRTVSDLVEGRGVLIQNRIPPNMVAEISRVLLVQAFSNLMHNALDAYDGLERRDPIVVNASASGEMIRLTISDRGCGMSADTVRAARTLFVTNKPHGNGVGLPLAIKIVDSQHDGEITIDSTEGDGTTITVTLPRFQRGQ